MSFQLSVTLFPAAHASTSVALEYLFAGKRYPSDAIAGILKTTKVLLERGTHLFWTTCVCRIPAMGVCLSLGMLLSTPICRTLKP